MVYLRGGAVVHQLSFVEEILSLPVRIYQFIVFFFKTLIDVHRNSSPSTSPPPALLQPCSSLSARPPVHVRSPSPCVRTAQPQALQKGAPKSERVHGLGKNAGGGGGGGGPKPGGGGGGPGGKRAIGRINSGSSSMPPVGG